MLKAIKVKLYLNGDQKSYTSNLLGSSRFIYNHLLNYKNTEYELFNDSINYNNLSKYVTNLKKDKNYKWLKQSHSKILQQSIRNLDQAFQNFFKNKSKFPKFNSF